MQQAILVSDWLISKKCSPKKPLLMNRDEMSNLYRGPSKDAPYQVSIHLAKRFLWRTFFRNHKHGHHRQSLFLIG
jgi:hypothetical protein